MIFVIIIAHAAQKSQHNFRFFAPPQRKRLPLTREALDPRIPKASPMRGSWLRSEAEQTDEVDCVT